MKAVCYNTYGSAKVLQVKEIDKPTPKKDELLIKVHAAEVTKGDCEMRSFHFPVKWFWLPLRIAMGLSKPKRQVLGGYFSGVVESVGKAVGKFKPGDQIFGASKLRLGAHGEYLCLPESYTLAAKPSNMGHEEAAAVPLGGLNALHFMRKANIQQGEKVLVNGAGGSIGTFAIQIAKTMGAEVTAVDSGIKEALLRKLGADHFFDYHKQDFSKSGQSYDVIFNMVARSSYATFMKVLNPKGRYLMGNPSVSDMWKSLWTSRLSDKTALFAFAPEKQTELVTLKEMIEAGKIKAIVDKVYPYEQAAAAHERVENEERLGAVILSPEQGQS